MSSVIWRNIIINIPLIVCHVGRVLPPSLCFWLSCLLACLLDCLLQWLDQLILFIFYCLISCLPFWLIDRLILLDCSLPTMGQHWANALFDVIMSVWSSPTWRCGSRQWDTTSSAVCMRFYLLAFFLVCFLACSFALLLVYLFVSLYVHMFLFFADSMRIVTWSGTVMWPCTDTWIRRSMRTCWHELTNSSSWLYVATHRKFHNGHNLQ